MPSTKRERDGLDDLNLTLDRLASLSPTERGAALFSYHARASDADLTRGDAVAVSMYGSSARRGDEDRDEPTCNACLYLFCRWCRIGPIGNGAGRALRFYARRCCPCS